MNALTPKSRASWKCLIRSSDSTGYLITPGIAEISATLLPFSDTNTGKTKSLVSSFVSATKSLIGLENLSLLGLDLGNSAITITL